MSSLQAENLFEGFDPKTGWRIKKNDKIYPNIKPVYEGDRMTLFTSKTSAAGSLKLMTDKELQQGETYDFYFSVRANGTGKVVVNYASKPILAKKLKTQSLGLRVSFDGDPAKKTYKCTFTVSEKKDPAMLGNFVIGLGEFKGKINLHSLKLIKSNGSQDVTKYGLIEDVVKGKVSSVTPTKKKTKPSTPASVKKEAESVPDPVKQENNSAPKSFKKSNNIIEI
ncbi:hypothetical protein PQO01_08700 [Lentisphaera marina]|uniref:hypothetical protein n=1 Tax=Lentisphaera marina TaxID=1111041 RepID=UPI002367320E|nr:hypothetical protein [Lentisphaera marina]MDD7985024.1 hypothetical protein [Lentisphaera marina]